METLLPVNVPTIVKALQTIGGISIPILPDEYRRRLLDEALTYNYVRQPEIVGPAKVREQLSSTKDLRSDSLFFAFRDQFVQAIEAQRSQIPADTFSGTLTFNDLSLQLYDKGSIGITPHMDESSRINLVCVLILTGTSRFAICADRAGSNPQFLDTTPGNIILLRAPGFQGRGPECRPMHTVTDITEQRIVLGLRQRRV